MSEYLNSHTLHPLVGEKLLLRDSVEFLSLEFSLRIEGIMKETFFNILLSWGDFNALYISLPIFYETLLPLLRYHLEYSGLNTITTIVHLLMA